MPVLLQEPDVYPELLFNDVEMHQSTERVWWVLHTRPRQEKSLARQLHRGRVPFYLPLIPRRWRLRGHTMTSYIPLFPGYVFLFGDRQERVVSLATRRVVRALDVPDQVGLWQDLQQTNRLIASGAPITPEDRLVPGMMVEVRSGPLTGLKGKILCTASGQRFVVQIDFIQRGASVLLDNFTLVKLPGDT